MNNEKSQLAVSAEGDIQLIMREQAPMPTETRNRLDNLEKESQGYAFAKEQFKRRERELEISLAADPRYAELVKLKEKTKIASKLHRETQTVINHVYREHFKAVGMKNEITNLLADALPEEPVRSGKRGRPRKNLLPEAEL